MYWKRNLRLKTLAILVHDRDGLYLYTLFDCSVIPHIGEKLHLTPQVSTAQGGMHPTWKVVDVSYRISSQMDHNYIKSVNIYVEPI